MARPIPYHLRGELNKEPADMAKFPVNPLDAEYNIIRTKKEDPIELINANQARREANEVNNFIIQPIYEKALREIVKSAREGKYEAIVKMNKEDVEIDGRNAWHIMNEVFAKLHIYYYKCSRQSDYSFKVCWQQK